ncbi:MAG: 5-guanidino-2-oxopentanoate decarboxylase [Rhizobiaceae bacterium]|nr:5-guanidino-2-oxopentanoate decarboxylase [Rhizobiaceae bacterium]
MTITCGEATVRLLARYGVTTVFGIPGVHTLTMCRGLAGGANSGAVRHVQARNEQGAGYMAEGWARATGEVGVAMVISGPGVTNIATALGQSYADSLPLLLISAEQPSNSIGKGWGVLHEVTEQKRVTEPLCAFSETARNPSDIPELMARAFTIFASERPRPCHISIPVDVQDMLVDELWEPSPLPEKPAPRDELLVAAAEKLKAAQQPAIIIGGGAKSANRDLRIIAECLGALVVSTTAGKGIMPDDHPLCLGGGLSRPEIRKYLKSCDCVLAVGTELSETETYVDRLELDGELIRIDIDPRKMTDLYTPTLAIVGDAAASMARIRELVDDQLRDTAETEAFVSKTRIQIETSLNKSEKQHVNLLNLLNQIAPKDTIWSGDACQIMYTGNFAMPTRAPRRWFYPSGFCTLGSALPNAIGAKISSPDTPVAVLVGDGGFMFTMPELLTAAQAGLGIPIILWNNEGLKQIRDDMDLLDIERVGVDPLNPDFVALAKSCHCDGLEARSEAEFSEAFLSAFDKSHPTLIVVREDDDWLVN